MDLHIRVIPNAKTNLIKTETQPDGSSVLRVYVTTVPEDGKANDAVIKLLAKHLDVAKSRLTITRGHTSRTKTVRIDP